MTVTVEARKRCNECGRDHHLWRFWVPYPSSVWRKWGEEGFWYYVCAWHKRRWAGADCERFAQTAADKATATADSEGDGA